MSRVFKTLKTIFFKTPARTIFVVYLLFAILGAVLLSLPFMLNHNIKLNFIDALFISVSQMSTTGLVPVSLVNTFNIFGGIILILIMQIGGIGIVLLIAAYWQILGKKITIKEINIVAAEQNQFTVKGILTVLLNGLLMIMFIEVVGIISLTIYLYIKAPWPMNFGQALFQSTFIIISAFSNSGMEMIPGNASFTVFQQQGLYFPQIITIIIVFLGGVGFWPLSEVMQFIRAKIQKKKFSFSFIAKLFLIVHLSISLISVVIYILLEYKNSLQHLSVTNALFNSIFMMNTIRNSGFYNTDITQWRDATKLFAIVLMFIGAAPNSSGGGIRFTTFLVVIAGLYAYGKNRNQTFIGQKAIKQQAVKRAFLVFAAGIIMIILASLLILISDNQSLLNVIFEVSSAFGTAGLTMGITPLLSVFSKIVLIIVMFIGRIGILTFVLMLHNKKETINLVKYMEIDIMVG